MRSIATSVSRRAPAFTLVELLVVISIITVVVAMLMPALGRMHEMANRARCTANLHDMGAACTTFANHNDGLFPMCYRMRDVPGASYPYYLPVVISQGDALYSNDNDQTLWTVYGTSWESFSNYGVSKGTVTCPSSPDTVQFINGTSLPAGWGSIIWTDYMYIGGLSTTSIGKSVPHWGTAVPAVTTHDANPASLLLAADLVFYTGGSAYTWDKMTRRYQINHATAANPLLPDFQNILYADGHVASHGPEEFFAPLDTVNNYSLKLANTGIGGFMYWGEGDVPPPPPPPAPVVPSPSPTPAPAPAPAPVPVPVTPPVPVAPTNPTKPPLPVLPPTPIQIGG